MSECFQSRSYIRSFRVILKGSLILHVLTLHIPIFQPFITVFLQELTVDANLNKLRTAFYWIGEVTELFSYFKRRKIIFMHSMSFPCLLPCFGLNNMYISYFTSALMYEIQENDF